MKKQNIFLATAVTLIFALAACNGGGTSTKLPQLKTEADSLNYAFGLANGNDMKMMLAQDSDSVDYKVGRFIAGLKEGLAGTPDENPQFAEVGGQVGGWLNQQKTAGLMGDSTLKINYDMIKQGMINAIKGQKTNMTAEQAQEYVQKVMNDRQAVRMMEKYGANKAAGEKFLADNKSKPGIQTTASGLQYEVIKEGKQKITGVKMYELDEKKMTITVYYNSKKTDLATIKKAISKLGYDADDVKAEPQAYENLDGCCKI